MNFIRITLFVCVLFLSCSLSSQRRPVRSSELANQDVKTTEMSMTQNAIREIQRQRKERRLLRKKKQRIKQLKEEIRLLTSQMRGDVVPTLYPTPIRVKINNPKDKWKKRVLDKMRGILRRLDRIEKGGRTPLNVKQVVASHMLSRVPTTTAASVLSTTHVIHTSLPSNHVNKISRIRTVAGEQSVKGENGTTCSLHGDCRPGRCCQKVSLASNAVQLQCSFYGLPEDAPCVNTCQCGLQLSCYQPKDNSTASYCKHPDNGDVLKGIYLNREGTFTLNKKKKKKK